MKRVMVELASDTVGDPSRAQDLLEALQAVGFVYDSSYGPVRLERQGKAYVSGTLEEAIGPGQGRSP